ncbi:MAG: DUF4835 family protein [Bacteroidales bacterium]|nr:DUF4835 family protein [Bacteroidales bacterium]
MKKTIVFLFIIVSAYNLFSQELNCRISINSNQIQGTNRDLYIKMQQDLYEFMNNRKWTNNVFSNNERIECQIQINLKSYNGIDKFKGNISIQSTRTIFNTNYKSTLFNYKEDKDFEFTYVEGQALDFNENTHLSNLTSVLAFYAYIIIGLDYDSYSMLGGTEFLQKAKQIKDHAQADPFDQTWQAFGTSSRKNRFYLIEHMTSNDNSGIRKLYYKYHRLGLDQMTEKLIQGRAEIANSIMLLKNVYNRKPDSYFLSIFLSTKMSEIVKIFSDAPPQEKRKVYNILKEIAPTNSEVDNIMKTQN